MFCNLRGADCSVSIVLKVKAMSIGLSRASLDGPRIPLRQIAHEQTSVAQPAAPYYQYRADFDSTFEPGPSFNTQSWIPDAAIGVPPAGSAHHANSVAKIAEAAIGAGAKSVMSYIPTLLAPLTAAIGAGGLTLWGASGISRWFGGGKAERFDA